MKLEIKTEFICKICGKQTHFYNIKEGYFKFCNSKCANKNVSIQNKIKQTLIDKYGKPYVFQNKELLEKVIIYIVKC